MANLSIPMAVMELTDQAAIRLEAIDPATGAAVAGVIVSNIAITALDLSDSANADAPAAPPLLVPSSV